MVTSLSTGEAKAFSLSLPGAERYVIHSAAAGLDRAILLAGSFQDAAGTTKGFLATTDPSGKLRSLSDLGSFTPASICSESDGSVWALGQEIASENFGRHDYDLLRNYTRDGKVTRSAFPRSAVTAARIEMHFQVPAFTNNAGLPDEGFLSCGPTSVGAYVSTSGSSYWYEFDTVNNTGQGIPVLVMKDARMTGLAVPHFRGAYASFVFKTEAGIARGQARLTFPDQGKAGSAARWWRVDTQRRPQGTLPGMTILGLDGDKLVHHYGPSSPKTPLKLYWSDRP